MMEKTRLAEALLSFSSLRKNRTSVRSAWTRREKNSPRINRRERCEIHSERRRCVDLTRALAPWR